jgi:hypothetical protein
MAVQMVTSVAIGSVINLIGIEGFMNGAAGMSDVLDEGGSLFRRDINYF